MNGIDIEKRRKELELTLEQVGKHVGVSKSTVKKWETGYIENMKRDKIVRLAEVLKVSPLDIMGIEAPMDKPQNENKPGRAELEEDTVMYHRDGKTVRKKIPKETKAAITAMLDTLPDDNDPNL